MAGYTTVEDYQEALIKCIGERWRDEIAPQKDASGVKKQQSHAPLQIPRGWGYNDDGSIFKREHEEVIKELMLEPL